MKPGNFNLVTLRLKNWKSIVEDVRLFIELQINLEIIYEWNEELIYTKKV